MSDDVTTGEWPLIAFTMGMQVACGIQLAVVAIDLLGGSAGAALRACGIAVFPLAVGAALCSVFHLGRPLGAWKSLLNFPRSSVSREVWVSGGFVAAAFASSAMWYWDVTTFRFVCGLVTAALGLAAVGFGASIYVIPARPVWNSAWVPMSFAATVLLAAGAVLPALAPGASSPALGGFVVASVSGSVLQIVSAFWMIVVARKTAAAHSRGTGVARRGVLDRSPDRWSFVGHVALAGFLPPALALWLSIGDGQPRTFDALISILALAGLLAGATLGRRLMFELGTKISRF